MAHTESRPRLWFERRGDGEPLLIITGFAISGAIFEPLIDTYAKRFDCITYDNRGAGRSDKPLWPTSMPELAWDAVRLLDELGVQSAHVYGVSMGGMVAQELALRFPERVRALILGCTTAGGPLAARPALGGLVRGRPSLASFLFSPEFRKQEPARVRFLVEHFLRHPPSPHGATAQWWATVFHDTVLRLDRVQAPTLVFHGERDVLSPLGNAELLAARIPDGELAIVPGAGHAYALERPQESYDLLVDWLDRKTPIAAGRRRGELAVRLEPATRALGLPIGALRTGRSLLRLVARRSP
jgi:pimeloyl-ACP methyl ester carboxylesterase